MKPPHPSLKAQVFYLALFVFFTGCNVLFGQRRQRLNGRIVVDSIGSSAANIVNLTAKTGTVSNSKGQFKIAVKPGDSLWISFLGYQTQKLRVTDSLLNTQPILIALPPNYTTLNTIKINNLGLTGNLTKDAAHVDVFDQAAEGFPLKGKRTTTAQRRLHAASSGGGLIPINLIINAITGRMAMLKRQRAYEKIELKKSKTISALSMKFFTKTLQIPKPRLDDFVYYCIESKKLSELLSENKKLELVRFLRKKAKRYKILNNLN